MAMTPHYVHYLLTQGDLLNRILAFNADFSARQYRQRAQSHPEQIKDSLYTVHPELARFHEENNISYYFENNIDRLCLIRQAELETLLVYIGACINSRALAGVTIQDEKDQIYEQIGRDAYNFALDYGYLIKNLDFALNLASLKEDCTYLGLCALKCIAPLFSSNELREYFIELLLTFTKTHGLNPNIITSREHVLSIIYPVNDNIKAPYPSQMNTPAQYSAFDNTNQLIAARDAMEEQNKSGTTINGLSGLIHAEGNLPTLNQDNEAKTPSQENAEAEASAANDAQEMASLDKAATQDPAAPAQSTAADATPAQATPTDTNAVAPSATDAPAATNDTNAAAEQAQAEAAAATNTDANAAATAPDNADASSDAVAAAAQDPAANAPAPQSSGVKEPVLRADGKIDYSIVPEGVGAPIEVTYADAALYGSYIDKRKFRAASLKQRQVQKEILMGVPQEQKQVEEQQLITLEFGAKQVFDLTAVILKFQIDEHWHEYLQE
ncbi:SctK family type III secretion system sorting platform protein [Anaerobiospirillum succiniciproducens]|uniref:SctK family type III secretion system sorting platform protein n=1 Tax=Anaerobiospirillum succiniciproducens TaxID=13335 RepID=UPI00235561C5|nr:SctK family type III secretion system sorting platform protein [Anaerobiospirillum succiniciproducens]MCI6863990.1 Yop proteins translocation protein K [Anaerobiospirillum succiniciproducens]